MNNNLFTELQDLTDELSKLPEQKPKQVTNVQSGGIYILREGSQHIYEKVVDLHTYNITINDMTNNISNHISMTGEGLVNHQKAHLINTLCSNSNVVVKIDTGKKFHGYKVTEISLQSRIEGSNLFVMFMLEAVGLHNSRFSITQVSPHSINVSF